MSVCRHCGMDHSFTGGKCAVTRSRNSGKTVALRAAVTALKDRGARVLEVGHHTKPCPRCKGTGQVSTKSAAQRMREMRQRKAEREARRS